MKIARHALFVLAVVFAADATANGGAEMRALYGAAAPSSIVAKAKLASYRVQEDVRRLVENISGP